MGLAPIGGQIGPPEGYPPSPSVNAKLPLTTITSTGLIPILQYTPYVEDSYNVRLILNAYAAVTATVYITWTGADGNADKWSWMNQYPLPARRYSMPTINLYSISGSPITVYIQVSEVDVVAVAGSIDRLV